MRLLSVSSSQWKLVSLLLTLSIVTKIIAQPVKLVSGNVSGVWSADTVYQLNGNTTVTAGQTLTMQAGVEVIFPRNNSQLTIQGILNATGAVNDSIRFTGGGFPFEGNVRGPIIIESSSTNSVLKYVVFNALGYENRSGTTPVLIIRSASCIVENSAFQSIRGTAVSIENVPAIVRNNFFTGTTDFDVNVGIVNLPNLTGNNLLKIGLRSETITTNVNLPTGLALSNYYTLLGNMTVPLGRILTIQPGVSLSFPRNNSQLIVQGTLNATGTTADSIRFIGGDFPFEGNVRGPITIESTSTNSIFKYVVLNALGYENRSGTTSVLIIRSSSCVVENSAFRSIRGTAISIENVPAIVRNNLFTGTTDFDVNIGIVNLPNLTGNNLLKIGLRSEMITTNVALPTDLALSNYYTLLGNMTIPSGRTFTIQPGVSLSFPRVNSTQLIVQGTLKATGTMADSIRFIGGDFPFEGNVRGPIIIESTSINSTIKYVLVDALGYENRSGITPTLIIRSASCIVENSAFRSTRGTAISVENVPAYVRNNLFTGTTDFDVNVGLVNLPNIIGNNLLKIGLRGETITTDVILPTDLTVNNYYTMLGNITVPSGRTLTIQSGVGLSFPRVNSTQLTIQGTLKATGTVSDSIRFTGGDFPFEGNQRGPIVIESTSTNSTLKYVVVDALGYENRSETAYALLVRTTSCSIENCRISNTSGVGLFILNNTLPTVKNNYFFGNSHGDIASYAKSFTNIFNNTNAKILLLPTTIDQNTNLPYPGTNAYYALSGTLTVNQGTNFTLASGTIIDFRTNSGNIIVNGSLTAIGTETGIIQLKKITSTNNTTLGGTISFGTASTGSILRNVLIDKLGNPTSPARGSAVEINTALLTLENVNITNCSTTGLKINNVSPTILNSNFLNNATAILSTGGQAAFNDCSFVGNTIIAINNTSTLIADSIDARNCWWGSPSGPRHILNTIGTGDTVAAKVRFLPFKTAAAPSLVICPGGSTYLQIASAGTGYNYQWQVDNGTGFTNLANSSIYSGVTTTTLTLTSAPSTLYGYRYRVIATLGGTSIFYAAQTLRFGVNWTGDADAAWENAENWSCGVLPDDNTDVFIFGTSPNSPVLSSTKSIRSINLRNGAAVLVKSGNNLITKGK